MGIWDNFCSICGVSIVASNNVFDDDLYDKLSLWWTDEVVVLTSKNKSVSFDIFGIHRKNISYESQGVIDHNKTSYVISSDLWPIGNHDVCSNDFTKQTGMLNPTDCKELDYDFMISNNEDYVEYVEAYVVHKCCHDIISHKFNYSLKFKDLYELIGLNDRLKYKLYGDNYTRLANSQFFNTDDVETEQDMIMVSNPLCNALNKKRIINIWKGLIKKLAKTVYPLCPSFPATKFNAGAIKYGNDGKLWISVELKWSETNHAWCILDKDNVRFYIARLDKLMTKYNKLIN